MAEPKAVWSNNAVVVFDREIGLTQNLVLAHGRSALVATLVEIDRLYRGESLEVHLPPILSSLCYHAGVASTILFEATVKQESESMKLLRAERVDYVERLCSAGGLEVKTLKNRLLRNRLTHIDERLPMEVQRSLDASWFVDSVLDSRNSLPLPEGVQRIAYSRCFIRDEEKIVHLDQEMHLPGLVQECVGILAVVFGVDARKIPRPRI